MSAVSGLKEATDAVTQQTVVGVSIAVLVLLFSVQRCGTSKVGRWVGGWENGQERIHIRAFNRAQLKSMHTRALPI